MLFLIALLLAPPPTPAEAAFQTAESAGADAALLLAEFAERWPKPPLGPRALKAASALARNPAERVATARAALKMGQEDLAGRQLGGLRTAESRAVRLATSIALADAHQHLAALRLTEDPKVAVAFAIDRLRADDPLGAAGAVLASPLDRGKRMVLVLNGTQQLPPAHRPTLLAHLAPGFLLLVGAEHASALKAWRSALETRDAPQQTDARIASLNPRPRWSIAPVDDRGELVAATREPDADSDAEPFLRLAEFDLAAGDTERGRAGLATAWTVFEGNSPEANAELAEDFVAAWRMVGDWSKVRSASQYLDDPADRMQTIIDALFAWGATDELARFVPLWLGNQATGCDPNVDGVNDLMEMLGQADLIGHRAAVDAAIAAMRSPVLRNQAHMARALEMGADASGPALLTLLSKLDPACPSDQVERHTAWNTALEQAVSQERHRLVLQLLPRILKRKVPIEDWTMLVETLHTAGYSAPLADVVLAHATPTARAHWLTALFEDEGDLASKVMALGARLSRLPLTAEQKQAVAEARSERPTVEPLIEGASRDERLDWLFENAENAVDHDPPSALKWIPRIAEWLIPSSSVERWQDLARLIWKATPPCVKAPCAAPPAWAALDAIADDTTRIEVIGHLLDEAPTLDQPAWTIAAIRALLKVGPDARCAAFATIDTALMAFEGGRPALIARLSADLPPELMTVIRLRQIEVWLEAGWLEPAWQALQLPMAPPTTCPVEFVPPREVIVHTVASEAVEWGRIDIALAAGRLVGEASMQWKRVWQDVANVLIDSGQIGRLEQLRTAASGAQAQAFEAALVQHLLQAGHLEQAVAQASSPAVRMRLLLAFAAAPALADQHAVRWRALLAP